MSIITIFSGSFCTKESVVENIINDMHYDRFTDENFITKAASLSGLQKNKIKKALTDKVSVFNKFTHEKEKSIAYLKVAVAEILLKKNVLITGFASQLIPSEITHVLKICLIADMSFRTLSASKKLNLSKNDAARLIRKEDESRAAWIKNLFNNNDPWDPLLYDIVIPVDKIDSKSIVSLIKENIIKDAVKLTESSKQSMEDFLFSAQIEAVLADEGHIIKVGAKNGDVTLTITKQVMRLSRLEGELKSIVNKLPGVKSIETKIDKNYYQADVYRKYNFEMPSKVLLVDDEREFVQTLSERLLMRDVGSAVAFDGKSALDIVNSDEPEVMILDLKMPGIDGFEVLRSVKKTRPEIEVIVLTGHGSEADKELCMKIGAFAYLQKPVDIKILSEMLQKANDKIHSNKKDTNSNLITQ